MTTKNDNGQPIANFRKSANTERALNTLFGICKGLVADQQLVDREVAYLSAWLNEYEPLLLQDGDGVDLVEEVRSILADGVITGPELEDLKSLLDCVVEHRASSRFCTDAKALQHLTGLVHGLVADGVIKESEVVALNNWMNQHLFLECEWPANIIFKRVRNILADGIITESEKLDLYDTLTRLNGGTLEETGAVGGLSTSLFSLDATPATVLFEGKNFLFTGTFLFGKRRFCEEVVLSRGGFISSGVNRSTDYLVVGALSSRDWINESFGRKIQKAMSLREAGHSIMLLDEEVWCNSI